MAACGAAGQELEELLLYNENIFVPDTGAEPHRFPLPDEPFVAAWDGYAAAAAEKGVYEVLKQRLIQFRFPVQEGISRSDAYQAATRRLGTAEGLPGATGLVLERPELLELTIHPTPAGRIPLLIIRHRADFVILVQALANKNEPVPVPDSMGAAMVTGYNNWDRIFTYKKRWTAARTGNCLGEGWAEEFQRLIPRKELYQDRFIILSDGPYSAVPAREMGLTETEWRRASLVIRREHECTHYFTRRLYGAMRNNILDELIADYLGIVAAAGHYEAGWFLRFAGLEDYQAYRKGGRLENYRGNPPLSDGAFRILQILVKRAAENLAQFDRENTAYLHSPVGQRAMLAALTRLTLE
ncbi:MAG TPA: hypothetical protein DEA44_17560, partial [Firmicutes bacterium]|nr:hypothetical protein [Bacillota bacterium]